MGKLVPPSEYSKYAERRKVEILKHLYEVNEKALIQILTDIAPSLNAQKIIQWYRDRDGLAFAKSMSGEKEKGKG